MATDGSPEGQASDCFRKALADAVMWSEHPDGDGAGGADADRGAGSGGDGCGRRAVVVGTADGAAGVGDADKWDRVNRIQVIAGFSWLR